MNIKYIKLIFVTLLFTIFACKNSETDTEKIELVKVYDKILYYDEIKDLIPEGTTKEDSAIKISNYIDLWVKKQLMIKKAELYLPDEQQDIEKKIEDYRSSLLIYKYKQKFIEQKMDTIISEKDIEEYYLTHNLEFKLKTNAIKGVYIKIPKSDAEINRVKYLLRSNSDNDSIQLHNYCIENATNYDDFNDNWMSFTEVLKRIPTNIVDLSGFLKSKKLLNIEDEAYTYLLKIKEYRLVGDIAPLKFVEDDIRSILLNKRKLKLINELEQNVYQNALDQGNLEFFYQ